MIIDGKLLVFVLFVSLFRRPRVRYLLLDERGKKIQENVFEFL